MCSQHVSPWPLNMILHRNFETIVAGVLPIPGYGGIDLSARKYSIRARLRYNPWYMSNNLVVNACCNGVSVVLVCWLPGTHDILAYHRGPAMDPLR